MPIASTFNSHRKYFHWHLKVLAFFTGVIDIFFFPILEAFTTSLRELILRIITSSDMETDKARKWEIISSECPNL